MDHIAKIIITESDKNLSELCKKSLKDNGIELVFCEKNGITLLNEMNSTSYDAVIAEAYMPGKDAVNVKNSYDQDKKNPAVKFFVMGTSSSAVLENELVECKAMYYFLKPFDVDYMARVVVKSLGIKTDNQIDDECDVTDILHHIGVPAHIKGYRFVRQAILFNLNDPSYMSAVTKRLYPDIATEYATTASRVERAIRHAIEVAWDRGDVDVFNQYFGYTIHSLRGKPTNSEFIAMISDRMRLAKKRGTNMKLG